MTMDNGIPGPQIISWNITLRCPLKCAHCYADAGEREAEEVLSTEEAFGVIGQLRKTGTPIVVLSGGEPLLRKDVYAIARHGTGLGLRMVMGTSGYLIDRQVAADLRRAGIRTVAVSIDSADPAVHDAFRGVPGVWERAVQAIRYCHDEGIGVRINMSVMRPSPDDVSGVIGLGCSLGVRDYQVFFPVPTGREKGAGLSVRAEYERLIRGILERYKDTGLSIRPTCAPQFRRIADQAGIRNPAWGRGCLAGITYCRISANGDVTPCPYLPVSVGNVRTTPFDEIWRGSAIFRALRNPALLGGKCGRCGYKTVCGGCRARAYRGAGALAGGWCDGLTAPESVQGDLCAEDPWCPYEPGGP